MAVVDRRHEAREQRGETSGIDLALRIVERYYGTDVAKASAYMMEYRRSARPQGIADV